MAQEGVESTTIETWLLSCRCRRRISRQPERLRSFNHGDHSGVYNVLYRYLFDRQRDLTHPTSFLVDSHGDIVKFTRGS